MLTLTLILFGITVIRSIVLSIKQILYFDQDNISESIGKVFASIILVILYVMSYSWLINHFFTIKLN